MCAGWWRSASGSWMPARWSGRRQSISRGGCAGVAGKSGPRAGGDRGVEEGFAVEGDHPIAIANEAVDNLVANSSRSPGDDHDPIAIHEALPGETSPTPHVDATRTLRCVAKRQPRFAFAQRNPNLTDYISNTYRQLLIVASAVHCGGPLGVPAPQSRLVHLPSRPHHLAPDAIPILVLRWMLCRPNSSPASSSTATVTPPHTKRNKQAPGGSANSSALPPPLNAKALSHLD